MVTPPPSLVEIILIPNPVFVKEKFRKIFHVRNKKRTFLSRIWSSPFSLLLRKTRLWAEVVFLLWAKLLSSSPSSDIYRNSAIRCAPQNWATDWERKSKSGNLNCKKIFCKLDEKKGWINATFGSLYIQSTFRVDKAPRPSISNVIRILSSDTHYLSAQPIIFK